MKRKPVFLVTIGGGEQFSRLAAPPATRLRFIREARSFGLIRNEAERPCAYCELSPPARRLVGDRRRLDPDQPIHLGKNPADRAGVHLTLKEQKRNIVSIATSRRE
jgi:hypothetical protein